MWEFLNAAGPTERISGRNVRVILHSRVPGRTHAGIYIAGQSFWRLNAAQYPAQPHTCNPAGGERGCVPATQLRALYAMLLAARRGTTFTIEMSSHEAALLVQQWQAGNLKPPDWFRQIGPRGEWLFKLSRVVAFNPRAFTVKTITLEHVRWGKQVRGIVDAMISCCTIRHPERREAAASAQIMPLIRQLPF